MFRREAGNRRQLKGLTERSQIEKAEAFAHCIRGRRLYHSHPWDAAHQTARRDGFRGAGDHHLGLANTLGSATVILDAIIEMSCHAHNRTDLPVNADLENCGADDPKTAAKAIARAAEAGVVGASIEDSTGDRNHPIYESRSRRSGCTPPVEAGARAAVPVHAAARAEKSSVGPPANDLDGPPSKRLQAFEAAGADVLYSPGCMTSTPFRTVVSSLRKTLHVVRACRSDAHRRSAVGGRVKRISARRDGARSPCRFPENAPREMKDHGAFTYVREMVPIKEVREAFREALARKTFLRIVLPL